MITPNSTIAALREAATHAPHTVFLRIAGEEFTFAEAHARTEAFASGLQSLGVRHGDRVACMSENRAEAIWTWFGANAIGAIDVPLNADAKGEFLAYLVDDAAPRVIASSARHVEALRDAGAAPETAVLIGGESESKPFGARTRHVSFDQLTDSAEGPIEADPAPDDVSSIIYTSGTTGPSKGVMVPQHHWPNQGEVLREGLSVAAGEVLYTAQPLFHQDARSFIQIALAAHTTVVIAERFSVSRFWDDIRAHEIDVFGSIGTMMWLLFKREPSEDDAQQPARLAASSAVPPEIHAPFEERFGLEVHQWYGQTETGCVTWTVQGGRRPGSIGRPTPSFEAMVVDPSDREVQPGQVGEFCCRPCHPNVMMAGYWRKPEATVEAWRNLWYHTGDLVREADDGDFEFVGRTKDAIRHHGENVSAWEVEQAATRHNEVLEAAAFGVPSPLGEQDVALLIVRREKSQLEPEVLHAFMSTSLPRFAVPRFIEFVDVLPKTPSERIEKAKVRARGLSATAWDADAT